MIIITIIIIMNKSQELTVFVFLIIIIIMNKSQELTFFHGRRKLIPLRIKGQKSDGRLQI